MPPVTAHRPAAPSDRGAPAPAAPGVRRDGPLSSEDMRQLDEARRRGVRIRRATLVAQISGWTTASFAAVSILFGLFSISSLVIGLGLAAVATNEIAASRRLQRLDARAPARLALNQAALCAVLIAYGTWGIIHAITAPSRYESYLATGGELADMLRPIDELHRFVALLVYGSLIVGSILAQSGAAWYYLSRRRHLDTYVSETPSWIIDLQRGPAGVPGRRL